MKVLCVMTMLVATVWAQSNLAYKHSLINRLEKRWAPFGFLDKIKDSVNGMIDTGVNIKDKIVSNISKYHRELLLTHILSELCS